MRIWFTTDKFIDTNCIKINDRTYFFAHKVSEKWHYIAKWTFMYVSKGCRLTRWGFSFQDALLINLNAKNLHPGSKFTGIWIVSRVQFFSQNYLKQHPCGLLTSQNINRPTPRFFVALWTARRLGPKASAWPSEAWPSWPPRPLAWACIQTCPSGPSWAWQSPSPPCPACPADASALVRRQCWSGRWQRRLCRRRSPGRIRRASPRETCPARWFRRTWPTLGRPPGTVQSDPSGKRRWYNLYNRVMCVLASFLSQGDSWHWKSVEHYCQKGKNPPF